MRIASKLNKFLLWIAFEIPLFSFCVLALTRNGDSQTTSSSAKIQEQNHLLNSGSLIQRIEDALVEILSESEYTRKILHRISTRTSNVIEIEFLGEGVDLFSDEGYASDNETPVAKDQLYYETHQVFPTETESNNGRAQGFPTPGPRSIFHSIHPELYSFFDDYSDETNKGFFDDISAFSKSGFAREGHVRPTPKPRAKNANRKGGSFTPVKILDSPDQSFESQYSMPSSNFPKSETNGLAFTSIILANVSSKYLFSEPLDEDFPRQTQVIAPLESNIVLTDTLSFDKTENSGLQKSIQYPESLETAFPHYEEIPELDLEQFQSDDPETGLLEDIYYNPMDALDSRLPKFQAGKWQRLLKLLKSITESGSRMWKPFHKSKPSKKEGSVANNMDTDTGENGSFLIGHAAWTKSSRDQDQAGFDGGLDHNFISLSADGKSVAFGITDGIKTESSGPKRESISKSICHNAKNIYDAFGHSRKLSSHQVLEMAYEEAVLDPIVAAGSTSALVGIIDEARELDLSFDTNSWLAVFSDGLLIYETGYDNDDQGQNFALFKKQSSKDMHITEHLVAHSKKIFSNVQKETWQLEKGDVILAATKGLIKRMNIDQIEKSIHISLKRGWDMMQAASSLVETAIGVVQVDLNEKPFWIHSAEREEDIMVVLIEIL